MKRMKKHFVFLAAVLAVFLFCSTVPVSAQAAEPVQPDCSSWAIEEVSEAIAKGLVPEHLQKDYLKPVTRGEVAELTAYYELWHEPEGSTFDDLWAKKDALYDKWRDEREPGSSSYAHYRFYEENVFSDTNEELYNRMYQFHYINGYPDGTFRPEGNVKRGEAAVIFWSAMEPHMGGHMYPVSWYTRAIDKFDDIDKNFTPWYERSIAWMWCCDCIKGLSDTIYGAEYPMTREQAIITVLRMSKNENYF